MSKLTLTYFNTRGRAEPIRFIFAYADVDYEDHRINNSDWPALKGTLHALPVLEVDGKVLNQSFAIARYLGKRFGLVADDPLKDAQLEALADNLRELQLKLAGTHKTPCHKKDCDAAMAFFLDSSESMASEGFFYGSEPTWVDIQFTGFAEAQKDETGKDILKSYPNLTALVNNVKSKNSLKKYLESRPDV